MTAKPDGLRATVSRAPWRERALTVAIAALGTAIFWLLGLPLPALFGPMALCLLAALAGARLRGSKRGTTAARAVLGVAVGASITPALVHDLPRIGASLLVIPVYVAVIAAVGIPFFRRVAGFDRPTAFYAAMPGGATDMLIFGEAAGANLRALSLVQMTRVLMIVSLAPIILTQFYGANLSGAVGAPATDFPPGQLLLIAFAAVVGAWGAGRIGLFGSAVLGPMLVAGALSLSGILTVRPPREAMLAAQFVIGLGLAVHYVGLTGAELRRVVIRAVAYCAILAAIAAGFTEAVTLLGLGDPVELFLAYAPGGQAEMAMLALATGSDLGFVVAHHLMRMVLVLLGAPLWGSGRRA